MKAKKIIKKLMVNKETISNLDLNVMEKVRGGILTDGCDSLKDCTVGLCIPDRWPDTEYTGCAGSCPC